MPKTINFRKYGINRKTPTRSKKHYFEVPGLSEKPENVPDGRLHSKGFFLLVKNLIREDLIVIFPSCVQKNS